MIGMTFYLHIKKSKPYVLHPTINLNKSIKKSVPDPIWVDPVLADVAENLDVLGPGGGHQRGQEEAGEGHHDH